MVPGLEFSEEERLDHGAQVIAMPSDETNVLRRNRVFQIMPRHSDEANVFKGDRGDQRTSKPSDEV